MRARGLLACAVALGTLGLAAQGAGAARVQQLQFDAEVTGVNVIDWQYASEQFGVDSAGWTHGSGTQTLGWSTPGPLRIQLVKAVGVPGMPPLSAGGIVRQPRVKATVSRISAWTRHVPPEVCEGGGCGPSRTLQPPQLCGRRALQLSFPAISFQRRAGSLTISPQVAPGSRPYANCAPDSGDGDVAHYAMLGDAALRAVFPGFDRAATLKRGGRLKLHSADAGPDCRLPSPPHPGQFASCSTTDVTLELTRVS